jgi:hypothetical protein
MNIEQKAHMIDQTASLDLSGRGVIRKLHDAALRATKGKAPCLVAARQLSDRAVKGDCVFILTGFAIPPMNMPETDGPVGAAVLVGTLSVTGLKPIVITDSPCSKVVGAGTPDTDIIEFPVNSKRADLLADKLLREHKPSALIAVERPGWNSKREYHNMRGLNISGIVGKTDYLFTLGQRQGTLTIGIGDGGNELGCGGIRQTVRRHVPYGAKCQCPCDSGIAAAMPADVLVVSSVSNWGAYSVAACLSQLKGAEYSHDSKREMQLLRRVVKAGAIDSISKEHRPYVDGLSPRLNGLVVDLICAITNA